MTEHAVCDAEDLPPGSHRLVTIGRLEFGVYNVDGEFMAVRNLCPHAGAPLCEGVVTGTTVSDGPQERHWAHEGKILKCPWHGWEFLLPAGETVAEPTRKVITYPAHVRDGKVIVSMEAKRRPTSETERSA